MLPGSNTLTHAIILTLRVEQLSVVKPDIHEFESPLNLHESSVIA